MIRVLIAAPLRQEPKIFREYQKGLDSLILPEGVTADRFFVVNDCPEVIPEIRNAEWVEVNSDNVTMYQNHIWDNTLVSNMSVYRNMTIRKALEGGYDYLLSVDTDLVLEPHTLEYLLKADKDCVAGLFWTNGWSNAWLYDQSDGYRTEWSEPGLYQVGGTGALFLIKRKVLEAGVDYTPIPNLRKAVFGEDRHFCIRAVCNGFEIWGDSHCLPVHLYKEPDYRNYMAGKVKTCFRK
ncbi:MAG: hypothetical protein IKG23_08455 [Clostridia bacterium]|nr:hypothetical protein [Clostridia bacterium]